MLPRAPRAAPAPRAFLPPGPPPPRAAGLDAFDCVFAVPAALSPFLPLDAPPLPPPPPRAPLRAPLTALPASFPPLLVLTRFLARPSSVGEIASDSTNVGKAHVPRTQSTWITEFRQTDREKAGRQASKQAGRQTDWQTDRYQTDRQVDGQTQREQSPFQRDPNPTLRI